MSYALNFKFELFFVFPFGTISYREAGYFSATGLTVSPDKEATGNTLSNEVGERKIFRLQAPAVLAGTGSRQSNFAEKISGLSAWSVSGERL